MGIVHGAVILVCTAFSRSTTVYPLLSFQVLLTALPALHHIAFCPQPRLSDCIPIGVEAHSCDEKSNER